MAYYLVRVGEGAKYAREAKKGGFIALGWNELPSLSDLGTHERIRSQLFQVAQNYTPAQIAMAAGQVHRFGMEMKRGDIVLSPFGGGEYLVGRVGDYYFENSPRDDCPYKHRRKVNWNEHSILKEDMSTNLSYSVGAILTIFSLDKYKIELEALIAGRTPTPGEKTQSIRDTVLSGLMEFTGKEFEAFIGHLLQAIGLTAEVTQYVGDKGIDVNGILDAEGLANITLRVQVKRVKNSIGNKAVLALRGALTSQGEQACLITTSTFTSQAIEEAQAPGKIPVKLIDGNDLAGIVLKHFDDIDEAYKHKFGIRRKKNLNIDDQFEGVQDDSAEFRETEVTSDSLPKWDTLVCAAKDEGFRTAFIEQKAWWAVRLSPKSIPHIKYIAMYQVAPISQITHYGTIDRIEPYQDTGKYKLYLDGDPIKLKRPVGLGKDPHLKPQGPKYAILKNIRKANTLDDVFK